MRSGQFVCLSVCLSVCLCVCLSVCVQNNCKSNQSISMRLDVITVLPVGRTDYHLMVIRSWTRIPDHFSTFLTLAEWGTLGDLFIIIFLTVTG